MSSSLVSIVLAVGAFALMGCRGTANDDASDKAPLMSTMKLVEFNASNRDKPKDPQTMPMQVVRLEVMQLSLPEGTVSRNTEFWKRINETSVKFATHDLLYKNGIRVGEAPLSEWPVIAAAIESNPTSVKRFSILALDARSAEVDMNSQPVSQTIFYYDQHNELIGRSFDKCENVLTISVQPTARKPGTVRVAMCPLVRSHRKKLEYTTFNDEHEIQFVHPERLYDINLKADVSVNNFLIISPSSESMWKTSIGSIFFMKESAAERLEQVLVLVPRLITQDVTPARTSELKR